MKQIFFILVAYFFVTQNLLFAEDTITLNNKEKIRGMVIHENEKEVTLDIGSGTVTFPRSDIIDIERESIEERSKREKFENEMIQKGNIKFKNHWMKPQEKDEIIRKEEIQRHEENVRDFARINKIAVPGLLKKDILRYLGDPNEKGMVDTDIGKIEAWVYGYYASVADGEFQGTTRVPVTQVSSNQYYDAYWGVSTQVSSWTHWENSPVTGTVYKNKFFPTQIAYFLDDEVVRLDTRENSFFSSRYKDALWDINNKKSIHDKVK